MHKGNDVDRAYREKIRAVHITAALFELYHLADLASHSSLRGTPDFPGLPMAAIDLANAARDAIDVLKEGREHVHPDAIVETQILAGRPDTRGEVLLLISRHRGVSKYGAEDAAERYDAAMAELERRHGKLDADGNHIAV